VVAKEDYSLPGTETWFLGWFRRCIAVLTAPVESMQAFKDSRGAVEHLLSD